MSKSFTIVQDRRDKRFYLVDDETESLLKGSYSTLAEARLALNRITSRIPQEVIDELLLSNDEDNQCLGRLLASETWPAFERWLNAERIDTADESVRVLNAIISFAAMVLAGVAKEHWPVGNPNVDRSIERLVANRLKKMMRAD